MTKPSYFPQRNPSQLIFGAVLQLPSFLTQWSKQAKGCHTHTLFLMKSEGNRGVFHPLLWKTGSRKKYNIFFRFTFFVFRFLSISPVTHLNLHSTEPWPWHYGQVRRTVALPGPDPAQGGGDPEWQYYDRKTVKTSKHIDRNTIKKHKDPTRERGK